MNIKQKFNSIDQSKLDSKQVEILKNIEQKTDGFKTKDKEVVSKIDMALDKIISALKEKNPEAIKSKKRTTSKTKTQKSSGGGKRTLFTIAKEIRKSDETWEQAKSRAKKIMEEENKQTTQKMKTETEKLLAFIKRKKELDGLSGTSIKKDSKVEALPKGRRVSKKGWKNQYGESEGGKVYYENRDNRTDRLAPNFSDKIYLANGGAIIGTPETPLARDLGIDYTGLVGETGAMSSGELFMSGGSLNKNDIEKLNAYWQSYHKGVMAGKKDDGYTTITNKEELHKYITSILGDNVKEIELIEKGKNYPYNNSYPYREDIYIVTLKNGTTFKIVRSYGKPKWEGNVDYKEQIIVENIKQYANGGATGLPAGAEQHFVNYYLGEGTAQGIYAMGGSLDNHGLKQGDQIIKTMSGGVQKVKTKGGDTVYVDLANGYRGAEPPLPFLKGGSLGEELMGGQSNATLKPSGYHLVSAKGREIIVSDDGGNSKERWVKNNGFSGYRLVYKGNDYEFTDSFDDGGETKRNLSRDRMFKNNSQKYEVSYSKNKPNRRGYGYAHGGYVTITNPTEQLFKKGYRIYGGDSWETFEDVKRAYADMNLKDKMIVKVVTNNNTYFAIAEKERSFAEGGFMTDPTFGDFQNQVYDGGGEMNSDKETMIYANQLLRRAVMKGDLTQEEANSALAYEIAEDEVEYFIDDDMEEMGSSDFGYMYRNFINSYNEVKAKSFATGGGVDNDITNELQNFDIENLDPFETMQYNQFYPSIGKVGALQVLINNVEGDYSQLSEELAELAEKQMSMDDWNEATREMMFERDGYATGGGVGKKKTPKQLRNEYLEKLGSKEADVWDKIGAESGSQIRNSDKMLKAYAEGVEEMLQKEKVGKGSFDQEDYDFYTDENWHLFNEFLVWNSYYEPEMTKNEKAWREKMYEEEMREKGKSNYVSNPSVITIKRVKDEDKIELGYGFDIIVEKHSYTNGKSTYGAVLYYANKLFKFFAIMPNSSKKEAINNVYDYIKTLKVSDKISENSPKKGDYSVYYNDRGGEHRKTFDTKFDAQEFINMVNYLTENSKQKSSKYIVKADIKEVKVKTDAGYEYTFKGSDVLNGVNVLEKGSLLKNNATYVAKRNIIHVELKNGEKVKPANGYWIKKDAKGELFKPEKKEEYKVMSNQAIFPKRGVGTYWYVENSKGQTINKNTGKPYKGKEMTNYYFLNEDGAKKFAEKLNSGTFEGGGKTTFKEKSSAIAKKFEGKKVEPKYQKEYGKTYDKAEAKEVGNKIAGSMKAKYDSKMSGGGKTKRGGSMVLAKQIRKEGESWASALKRANEQIKNK